MITGLTLIHALQRGNALLSREASGRVAEYVRSQMTPDDTFVNRGGKADLYYTMFGWMLCYVLGISTDDAKRSRYLTSINAGALDDLHRSVYLQARLLDSLLRHGRLIASLLNIRHYNHLSGFMRSYHRHATTRTLNSTAADLMACSCWSRKSGRIQSLQYILQLQDADTGGFRASEDAAMPDLLSTAVALFTLSANGIHVSDRVTDFIEAHFNEDGSFSPNIIDTVGDVEYVFYGLLALGSC